MRSQGWNDANCFAKGEGLWLEDMFPWVMSALNLNKLVGGITPLMAGPWIAQAHQS